MKKKNKVSVKKKLKYKNTVYSYSNTDIQVNMFTFISDESTLRVINNFLIFFWLADMKC